LWWDEACHPLAVALCSGGAAASSSHSAARSAGVGIDVDDRKVDDRKVDDRKVDDRKVDAIN